MIMIILIIAATITTLLVALRAYMSAPGRVLKELAALPDRFTDSFLDRFKVYA